MSEYKAEITDVNFDTIEGGDCITFKVNGRDEVFLEWINVDLDDEKATVERTDSHLRINQDYIEEICGIDDIHDKLDEILEKTINWYETVRAYRENRLVIKK